jgi:two-component sensor histidine kinase
MTSATFYRVVKEGELDFNSCLVHASRSLGLSRLPVLAEGIDDPELLKQSQWIDRMNPAVGIQQLTQLKEKKRLHQLLLVGAYYAFKPQPNFEKDSAVFFLSKAIEESKRLGEAKLQRAALCLLGKTHLEVNELKSADALFSLLIQDCKKAGDREAEARAYTYWALYPVPNPQIFPAQIERFQQAAYVYHELNNKEGEINALLDAGYLYVPTLQLPKAQEFFSKSLQLAEDIQYPYTHYHTDALAMVTYFQSKFGEPLKYTVETIKTAETTKDSIGWAYFYGRMGHIYQMANSFQRENERSLKWMLKALDRFVLTGDANLYQNLYTITSALGETNRGQEALQLTLRISKKVPPRRPAELIHYYLALGKSYYALKNYQLAEQYTMKAERLQEQFVTLRGAHQKALAQLSLGEIYMDAGQLERSREYLEQYLSNTYRNLSMGNELSAISRLATIDSTLGNTASALHRNWQYRELLDSNFRVSKIRQAEELQVMYETQEKEAQIALLNERAKLEQANTRQAMLFRNMMIGGVVVAVFIAAMLYRQSQHRQKTNKIITHTNEQLHHLLTEKEWLLKEIHHRVKNNLQVVMSLLNSQTSFIDNPYALTAIHDSQHRVHAMSLIHQKLYGGDNVTSIDMSIYIRELASYLSDSFDAGQRIHFKYNLEPIVLDVGQAVPLGLILNEAITNALKYAFPDGKRGTIAISLSHAATGRSLLLIADDGIGIPTDFSTRKTGSLGMSLMQGLSEDLEGDFSIENQNGTIIRVSFLQDNSVKRHGFADASFLSGN